MGRITIPGLDGVAAAGDPIQDPIVEGVISEVVDPVEGEEKPFIGVTVDVQWPETAKGRKISFRRYITEKSLPFLKRFLKVFGLEHGDFEANDLLGKKVRLVLAVVEKRDSPGEFFNEVKKELPAEKI